MVRAWLSHEHEGAERRRVATEEGLQRRPYGPTGGTLDLRDLTSTALSIGHQWGVLIPDLPVGVGGGTSSVA